MAFFMPFRVVLIDFRHQTIGTKSHYSNYEEYSFIPQSVTLFVSAYISLTKTYKFHFPILEITKAYKLTDYIFFFLCT